MVRMIAGRLIERMTETEPLTVVVNPTVTWNPSASTLQITLKDWNRGFELGDLSEWTALNAEISLVEPYEGKFCCKLIGTDSRITQTLDYPVPVTGVWMFRFRCRSAAGTKAVKPIVNYVDGTSSEGGQTIWADEWTDVIMLRRDMHAEKIISGIAIESAAGELYIDNVFLGLATEIIAGAVEAGQGTPRNLQGEMIARPMGGIIKTGNVALPALNSWSTVAEYSPLDDWKFELSKILVSCADDVLYRLRWKEVVISADQIFITGGIPFTDWFPWDYEHMRGDREVEEDEYTGNKTFEIQVSPPTADEVGSTCYAEIVGEYVKWAFNL